ncbi:NACHT domain-containing protein [Mucilaginibacter auburnensis]|uniref:NACHT domain-containing protein n=1 Tax=Mucilaginibacter auburnensis TaxID=1457233 RepID=A0A2H9VR86_9SPHI|nr:hypothetical protein [Mucilaginibacter auburnensis]PJJ83332.1 hypothetical protein CLV57_0312 [Mucilaginibacter auburnensis]
MNHFTVKDKLRTIKESRKETTLFPYLQQLFAKMDYQDVQITHGIHEYGKDLVFREHDSKKRIDRYTAVVVKNKDSGQTDFEDGGEVMRQIKLAFDHPFVNDKGENITISEVLVVINGTVSPQVKSILKNTILPKFLSNVEIWNYQRLTQEIENYIKDDFLSNYEMAINNFKNSQIHNLSKVENTKELFHGLSIKDINDIYVSVKTSYQRFQEKKETYIKYDEDVKAVKRTEELDDSLIIGRDHKDFFVYGLPTSGKSLLLKRIGINALNENYEKPVAVFYWEFASIKENVDLLSSLKSQYAAATNEAINFTKFSKLILLFDGLDEIKDPKVKSLILENVLQLKIQLQVQEDSFKKDKKAKYDAFQIAKQLLSDPFSKLKVSNEIIDADCFNKNFNVQLIISSRDRNFIQEHEILNSFEKVELLPFDVGQAFKLVKKLIPNDVSKSNHFVNALKDGLLTNKLVRTPLALTLMAILYREDQIDLSELPANITELYNKFTDYYLERWDSSKGLGSQYKYEEARQIMAMIASKMHCEGEKSITESNLSTLLEEIKGEYDFKDLKDISGFIDSLKDRQGLIQYDEHLNEFYFYHLTFQEYFASVAFDDSNESVLNENFFSDWWENTMIFYCGKQPKRDKFIKELYTKNVASNFNQSYKYFSLISRCLQANHLISRNLKYKILLSLLHNFDLFYTQLLENDSEQESGITYWLTTIDFTIQLRDIFLNHLSTKHLNIEDLNSAYSEIKGSETYSDMTKYCLAYLLTTRLKDSMYLIDFLNVPGLNVRWSRIVYVDLRMQKLDKGLEDKILSKINKRQGKNKDYIKKQLKERAIKHLKASDSTLQSQEADL